MKSVIQRVARASVSVGGEKVAAIGRGLMILLCAVETDSEAEAEKLEESGLYIAYFPRLFCVINPASFIYRLPAFPLS